MDSGRLRKGGLLSDGRMILWGWFRMDSGRLRKGGLLSDGGAVWSCPLGVDGFVLSDGIECQKHISSLERMCTTDSGSFPWTIS